MKTVLVTGGAGFLGSHLCDYLINKGEKVICVDNLFTGDKKNIEHLLENPNFRFINHDIIDPLYVEDTIIDQIYNLACPASPIHYQFNPVRTIKANTIGVINMLGLAKTHKARILQASTSEIYGDPLEHPQKETYLGNVNTFGPRSCYDEGKRFSETLVSTYKQKFGIDAKIARIFRTYGTRMKLDDGQMLPDFVFSALENKELKIYGDENFSSSFCYVSDVIQGILKFMQSDEAGPINFGSDIEYKLNDVAKKVIELTDSKSKMLY